MWRALGGSWVLGGPGRCAVRDQDHQQHRARRPDCERRHQDECQGHVQLGDQSLLQPQIQNRPPLEPGARRRIRQGQKRTFSRSAHFFKCFLYVILPNFKN